jgi:transglutaminase-like putative cysteine protease
MKEYLIPSKYINFDNEDVSMKAIELSAGLKGDQSISEACYKFVRDEIQHSWDYKRNPITCQASEVLKHRTGYCYAKSHLLAALLRANGIPAGICYQRLSVGDSGAPYSLHALNAVYLEDIGWYRCDARGNKKGVNAQFTPPHEVLAFSIREPEECDLPEIWPEPLSIVTEVLERFSDVTDVYANLPDIALWANIHLQQTAGRSPRLLR